MRQDERVIYMPGNIPPIPDLKTRLRPTPGRVVVRPLDSRIINGLHHVQEQYGAKMRRDCGHVVAAGEGVPLTPGQFVIFRPFDGLWLDKETYIFGNGVPWYDSIPGEVVKEHGELKLKPFADWVLAEMEPLMLEMQDGEANHVRQILPLIPAYHTYGKVLAVGNDVDETLLGKKIEVRKYMMYNETATGNIRIFEADHDRVLDFKFGFSRPSWGLWPVSEIVAEHYA